MCGRYNMGDPMEEAELREILRSAQKNMENQALAEKMKTSGEIFPSFVVPVITSQGATAMQWGLPLFGGKFKVINSRTDKLWTNGEYVRLLAKNNRCLVPMAYYYEWEDKGKQGKRRYRFMEKDTPMMYVAGVFKAEDVENPCFSIVTTEASKHVAWIHDRMPLILPPEAREEWLKPGGALDNVIREAVQVVKYQEDNDRPRQIGMFDEIGRT